MAKEMIIDNFTVALQEAKAAKIKKDKPVKKDDKKRRRK